MASSRMISSILYPQATPPPRERTIPMAVLCLGPPRSATESLAVALQQLGFTTYHGWDVVSEQPPRTRQWVKLADQKWGPSQNGDSNITREQFDELLGHADALADSIPFAYPAELVAAYPEAKVILNYREDLDAWHRSVCRTFATAADSWFIWLVARFSPQLFWSYEHQPNLLWRHLFRSGRQSSSFGIRSCGKWVYREHCAMVRGLMVGQENRYLEWKVEDGWGPLCKFLGKEVPAEPFPRLNDASAFEQAANKVVMSQALIALRNMAIFGALLVGSVAALSRRYDLNALFQYIR